MQQEIQKTLDAFRKYKYVSRFRPLYQQELIFFIKNDDEPVCQVS